MAAATADRAASTRYVLGVRLLGAAGSAILAVGATSAGVRPLSYSRWAWPELLPAGPVHLDVIACYLGLTVLVGCWLVLGREVLAGRVSVRTVLITLAWWALPLMLAPPLYSRDLYSYLVQGAMLRDGVDPYRFGADAYANVLSVNVSPYWQHSTAPYGPVFLWVAGAVMWVAGEDVVVGVLLMRLVMLLAAVCAIPMLLRLARRFGADGATTLWLAALNPLVLAHVVSGAHNDTLLVVLVLAATLLGVRERPFLAAALIGVAVLIKVTALVALLFLVPAAARRLRVGRGAADADRPGSLLLGAAALGVVCGATVAGITAASGGWYGWVTALSDTARVINGLSMPTNLGLLLSWLTGNGGAGPVTDQLVAAARLMGLGAASLLLLAVLLRTRGRPLLGVGLALVIVVLLGPVVHPWYVLWGFVPLAAVAWRHTLHRWVVVASVGLTFYPMPAGGGPDHTLWFGLIGIVAGAAVCWWQLLLSSDRPRDEQSAQLSDRHVEQQPGDRTVVLPDTAAAARTPAAAPGAV